nr:hypothetical protein [Tanacetum cinerariifolium]
MVVVDGIIDWDKKTKESNTEPRSLENFGMIVGIKLESDDDSKGEVVFADAVISADVSISAGLVTAATISPQFKTEFALMGLSTEAAQEKQDLMTKLDNELANQAKWNNSGKNFYKLIDSSMSVRTKQGLGLDKYIGEGKLGIDDSVFSIFHTTSDDLEGKPIYNCYLHLIKDCDFHEQTFVKRISEEKVSAGQPNPVSAGQPNSVSAGQQNTVSASLPHPVYAGQPNPVSAGNGILGPRPLNIQPTSTYFHSFTHNNQQIIFPITHNSLYSLYMTGGLNGKTGVKSLA